MLRRAWERIAGGGTWTVGTLAKELGTTPAMVRAMVEELARRGYLRAASSSCGESCASCSISKGCVRGGVGELWTVSDEGSNRRVTVG